MALKYSVFAKAALESCPKANTALESCPKAWPMAIDFVLKTFECSPGPWSSPHNFRVSKIYFQNLETSKFWPDSNDYHKDFLKNGQCFNFQNLEASKFWPDSKKFSSSLRQRLPQK